MKRLSRRVNKWLTKGMEVPADVTMGVARVTMIGQLHVYIENHRGILSFSPQRVHLRLFEGELIVTGQDLIIKRILPEELILEGTIEQVTHTGKG
ncbi:sporulation protein YqfC [Natribacillus halophilus]|uniref:Sporulation protein YqfC n=1 Tax=Natribacillus halophilus TaxID=549003 RepID=A0A1G8JSG2_9BACI|nr:sporulation protein YqfC [Natribacillus halophilus]SDI34156.1 sporulation protein YqfC [Natribacillus halophilus]